MINKLAKAQKSWVAKLILTLTALSFMSLFGVSGYINSAGQNRTVIEVDNIEISQAQFYYQFQKELNAAQNLLGDEADLTEDMRQALLQMVISQMVQDAVLDRTEAKYHVLFSPALIQAFIVNDGAFKDASGNFNRDLFRQVLSRSGISEAEFVQSLKRDLTKRILVNIPVQNFNVPAVLVKAAAKADNKRRTFNYVMINPENVVIDRAITEEEINQYYDDFSSNFVEPERRDVKVLYLSMADIAENMQITDDDIQAYYNEHKAEFETPEKRNVLQMIFADETSANKAFFKLQNGEDFYVVAESEAGQSKEDTDLGYVAEDELIETLAQEAFTLDKGAYGKPFEVDGSWQILKVADIEPASKTAYETAALQIKNILKDERLYDATYETLVNVEDALAAGESLEAVADKFNAKLTEVKGLAEDGSVKQASDDMLNVVQNRDFADTAFSYNVGEVSQVVETDEGIAVLQVEKIAESHVKDLADVRDEIVKLWSENERTAIAQEKLNDVMYDMENGDKLEDAAKRYGLALYKSQPITRNETFANIGYADIREMFTDALLTPKQIQLGNTYIVAVATQDYESSDDLSESETALVKQKAYLSLLSDFSEAMLSAYAKDYDIKIEYKLLGTEY